MSQEYLSEPLLDLFIFETLQNIEQLEKSILKSEQDNCLTQNVINEIFRVMHTIKGSAAMMLFHNIELLAHAMEDLFFYIREEVPKAMDYNLLSDLVLEGADFIRLEIAKAKNADALNGDPSELIDRIQNFLALLTGNALSPGDIPVSSEQKSYEAVIYFDQGCEMENIRAYAIVHHLKDIVEEFHYYPEDILENSKSIEVIREQGFRIVLRTEKSPYELHNFFTGTAYVCDVELNETGADKPVSQEIKPAIPGKAKPPVTDSSSFNQGIISVDVMKLDKLMDLMGEMVIAEAMVTQNPDLQNLELSNFNKAARQLHKITGEMQDMIMSIRMVPLTATFHKMNRIVRDMSRKLEKEVELKLVGADTEVDKNIIEHISDPLMHLVRNAVDHGIEASGERSAFGKPEAGQITLEARNAGSDVLVTVRDDGRGLNKERILNKAIHQGLISKPENDLSDREIFNLIYLPGFSTNDNVTEYSGRGVGMDVVVKNLEAVGGSVLIDSKEGAGTVTTMKIPLTLAIIDGMNIRVGSAMYTLPITSIKESFRPRENEIFRDPAGNEMIMVRGQCYPILRLYEFYDIDTDVTDISEGILIMTEQEDKCLCLFADELLGQQQVVVKSLPSYIKSTRKLDCLAGCTLLGDGSISLILNISELISVSRSIER